jgi:hypothetical protein
VSLVRIKLDETTYLDSRPDHLGFGAWKLQILRRSCCAMPVPRSKSDPSRFCSFQTQLNRDCDLVHLPEPSVDLGDKPFIVCRPVMSTIAKKKRTRERSLAGTTLKVTCTWVGNDSNDTTHVSPPGSDSMTEPWLAGTTTVVSSVFGNIHEICNQI